MVTTGKRSLVLTLVLNLLLFSVEGDGDELGGQDLQPGSERRSGNRDSKTDPWKSEGYEACEASMAPGYDG